jgi:hypothetical protein
VKDPETGWSFVSPVNIAELDLRGQPNWVGFGGHQFTLRNSNSARVEYVLGEVYWKCELGELTGVMDFVCGDQVLSRETAEREVRWSLSKPLDWSVIAEGFRLPVAGPGAVLGAGADAGGSGFGSGSRQTPNALVLLMVIGFIILVVVAEAMDGSGGGSSVGGVFYGGK